jgi:hypothetical protein
LRQVDHSKARQLARGTQMFGRHPQTIRQCSSRRIVAPGSHADGDEIDRLPHHGHRLDGVMMVMPGRLRHR